MSKDCLPPHLRDAKHWDWPKPLQWVPRSWTSFCFGGRVPKLLAGNQTRTRMNAIGVHAPAPIGEPGSWQISWPPYIALTTRSGRHFRLGLRWDDVDDYYALTAASRVYPPEGESDTSTR